MPDEDTNDPHLAVELAMAIRRLRARLRTESAAPATGWTISQLSTLSRIIRLGPLTASAVAQIEHVRPQSVAGTLAVLKHSGLITAEPDPTDGRKTLLSATDEGRSLVRAISSSREAWLARAIEAELNPAERRSLGEAIDLLNRLADCDLRPAAEDGWRG